MRLCLRVILPLLALVGLPALAPAQSADDARTADALSRWIALPAAPGAEDLAAPALGKLLSGWTRDQSGNWIKRVGQGSPRRVVACGLDVTAYVVSEITEQGYLRLHRSGTTLQHPLADQFLEATRVQIHTAVRAVPGVVAIANGHFSRQHRADTTVVGVDQLWVDVGASSRAEVEKLGIALLDPVIPDRAPWTWGSFASGPGAATRAGCAAVATASQGTVTSGETIFIISAQHVFGWNGLTGALRRIGPVNELAIVDVTARTTVPQAKVIVPKSRYTGSLVESMSGTDARTLLQSVAQAAGVTLAADASWLAPALTPPAGRVPRSDAYEATEKLVTTLLDLPGVPGHEWRVRNAIRASLPKWAADRAVVDSAGNLIVAVGPDKDSVAFVAHTDEVSFEVDSILPDGHVTLTRKGGVIPSAWEGQPAMLVFDPDASGNTNEALRGVFVPRETARSKAPPRLLAWFGLDADAPQRVHDYAFSYLRIFGDDVASMLAGLQSLTSPSAVGEALKAIADTGLDEFILVATSADVDDAKRAADLIGSLSL